MDEEALARPVKWQSGAVSGFMCLFGPVNSAFDILTFVALFFWICPAVAGGSWEALAGDAAARLLFAGTFQAAWFAESMVTQMLFVHLARTEKKPFVESRADVRLAGLSAGAALLSLLIPETVIGALRRFRQALLRSCRHWRSATRSQCCCSAGATSPASADSSECLVLRGMSSGAPSV